MIKKVVLLTLILILISVAIGFVSGAKKLFPYNLAKSTYGNSGAKSLNSDWNVVVTETEVSEYVPTRTIDQLYRVNEQFSNIKLVKIDVEGLEYDVISGAAEFLNNVRPYIVMEYRIDITNEAKQNLQRCVEEGDIEALADALEASLNERQSLTLIMHQRTQLFQTFIDRWDTSTKNIKAILKS